MSETLSPSSLIFPEASKSLQHTLTQLKRVNLGISNRLRSIEQDAKFVLQVARGYRLPLVANERCGSWYVAPDQKQGSAYFKSTDGHFGQWLFSLRRLNLQVLDVVGAFGGCIIVDSTRKGKSMPDALSKTIPIWIAVMNALLFPERTDMHAVRTPEDVVSDSEHSQIQNRLSGLVEEARKLRLDIDGLRQILHGRPMKPQWVTPRGQMISSEPDPDESYNLLVLCTASSRDSDADNREYVQGAADDHESWGLGLDAVLFWDNVEKLLATPESDLPDTIAKLIGDRGASKPLRLATLIKPTESVWIASSVTVDIATTDSFDVLVVCEPETDLNLAQKFKGRYISLKCQNGKLGSRKLRSELCKLEVLGAETTPGMRVLFACSTGRDLSVGAALAFICMFCRPDGALVLPQESSHPVSNKTEIKQRLSWIMVSSPDVSPSRATLQSVNAYLME